MKLDFYFKESNAPRVNSASFFTVRVVRFGAWRSVVGKSDTIVSLPMLLPIGNRFGYSNRSASHVSFLVLS